ncbi:hypothetical protein BBKW_0469 [Bifidobacterium catenulatum subsp. kashiwanohense JCM 15439 = DSM 21854]|nr:hypothetical protein BBKW_0469 [Bifidobacterium catenulatum subsp. kashiwanohense JCM 15439 = DSM 21854]
METLPKRGISRAFHTSYEYPNHMHAAHAHPLHNEKRQPTIGLAFFIA